MRHYLYLLWTLLFCHLALIIGSQFTCLGGTWETLLCLPATQETGWEDRRAACGQWTPGLFWIPLPPFYLLPHPITPVFPQLC